MEPLFAVVRTVYEYDDERYYESSGGVSLPKKVYKDRAKAEQEWLEKTIEWASERDGPSSYVECSQDLISTEGLEILLRMAPVVCVHAEVNLPTMPENGEIDVEDWDLEDVCKLMEYVLPNCNKETQLEVVHTLQFNPYGINAIYVED